MSSPTVPHARARALRHQSRADAAGAGSRSAAPGRAAITNLGCKVNQSEMDAVARLLRERGVTIVAEGQRADLHVVNTCTVTAVADEKSRKAVRRARRASPEARLLVTGCSVQVGAAALAAVDPAALLIGNDGKDRLLGEVE
jgi:threonylcarbamoyladenosine tRNA methylthiotransferase MtaB